MILLAACPDLIADSIYRLLLVCRNDQTVYFAENGMATQRWHPLAATLAGLEGTASAFTLPFNAADAGNSRVAATIQDFSCKLGRIEDVVQELDSLPLQCPALSSVTAQGRVVQLMFLGLEAEVKFTVQVEIGKAGCECSG